MSIPPGQARALVFPTHEETTTAPIAPPPPSTFVPYEPGPELQLCHERLDRLLEVCLDSK